MEGYHSACKMIQDKTKLPVVLTNDANAAAVGEMMYGAAQGMKDFIADHTEFCRRRQWHCC